MLVFKRHLRGIAHDRRGSVTILTVAAMTALLASTAFAVDMGSVYLANRKLQGVADAAALAAVGTSGAATAAAQQVIADNRLAECAGWDDAKLASEVAAIAMLDADFDLALTGFDGGALERLLEQVALAPSGVDELLEPAAGAPVVSRGGDTSILGNHRLLVGDALDPAIFELVMAGELAKLLDDLVQVLGGDMARQETAAAA